jgi:hypothetical protein
MVDARIVFPPDRAKIVQIAGDNNRNITQRAAEPPPKYRARKKKK